MTISNQCQYTNENGTRCQQKARHGSIYCRRCELKLQRIYGLLNVSKDFYKSHESPKGTRFLFLGLLVIVVPLTISAILTTRAGLISIWLEPFQLKTILGSISLIVFAVATCGLCLEVVTWYLSEITSDNNRKRKLRTFAWRFFGFVLFPLLLVFWVVFGITEGVIMGWKNLPISSAFTSLATIGILLSGYVIAVSISNPNLYLKRWLSFLFTGGLLFSGIIYLLEFVLTDSLNPFGIPLALGSFFLLIRDLRFRKTLLQQIIESIYTLPELINGLVSIEQRRMALIIGIRKFSQLTELEQEEVIKHLMNEQASLKSKDNLWMLLWKGIKFVAVGIAVYFVTEGPAALLFNKLVEWLEKSK